MADLILITPEQLKEQAVTVKQYREMHHEVINRLTNLVLNLGESWEGEAQDAFVSKYQGMQSTFTNFEEALGEFAVIMENISDKMQTTDQSLASKINSISL